MKSGTPLIGVTIPFSTFALRNKSLSPFNSNESFKGKNSFFNSICWNPLFFLNDGKDRLIDPVIVIVNLINFALSLTNKVRAKFPTHWTLIAATIPLFFWYFASFEPLNHYGDEVVKRLAQIEQIITAKYFKNTQGMSANLQNDFGLFHFTRYGVGRTRPWTWWRVRRMIRVFMVLLFIFVLVFFVVFFLQ